MPPDPNSKIRNSKSNISLHTVAIANRQRALRINERRLSRLAKAVLAMEQVAQAEISVAIVDDAQIHAINRRFLNHDFPTDVISFLLDGDDVREPERPSAGRAGSSPSARPRTDKRPSGRGRRGTGKSIEGEIVISAETACRNAVKYRVTQREELDLYLVHGLLHLCGYDDRSPRERKLMRRRETEALAGEKFSGRG